jgi:hypothetical protein
MPHAVVVEVRASVAASALFESAGVTSEVSFGMSQSAISNIFPTSFGQTLYKQMICASVRYRTYDQKSLRGRLACGPVQLATTCACWSGDAFA